jgi:hypothetical protein
MPADQRVKPRVPYASREEFGAADICRDAKRPWLAFALRTPVKAADSEALALEQVEPLIHEIRDEKVILDSDLARLYGTQTGALNRAVKRNRERFPADFLFRISPADWENLKCQIGISSSTHGGRRRGRPYVQTGMPTPPILGAVDADIVSSEKTPTVAIRVQFGTYNKKAKLRSQAATSTPQTVGEHRDATNSSQFAMSSARRRGATYRPWAFTEHGAIMGGKPSEKQEVRRKN